MRPALRFAAILAVTSGLNLGCAADPLTQLVVVVDTDFAVPSEVDELSVRVTSAAGETEARSAPLTGAGAVGLPLAIGVVHRGGPLEGVTIAAQALRTGGVVLETNVVVAFTKGQTRMVRIVLDRACPALACGVEEACVGTPPSCRPRTVQTEPWQGKPRPIGRDGGTGAPMDAGQSRLDSGGADAGVDAGSDAGVDAGVPFDAGGGRVVINEISEMDPAFWVELYNPGTEEFDLSAFWLTDTEVGTGRPRLAEGLSFPAGTLLPAGEYLVIMTKVAAPRFGLQSTGCVAGVMSCFDAEFGLSRDRGETVWLLAPDMTTVITSAMLPAGFPETSTWARSPNGTGAFTSSGPTPGAANP